MACTGLHCREVPCECVRERVCVCVSEREKEIFLRRKKIKSCFLCCLLALPCSYKIRFLKLHHTGWRQRVRERESVCVCVCCERESVCVCVCVCEKFFRASDVCVYVHSFYSYPSTPQPTCLFPPLLLLYPLHTNDDQHIRRPPRYRCPCSSSYALRKEMKKFLFLRFSLCHSLISTGRCYKENLLLA